MKQLLSLWFILILTGCTTRPMSFGGDVRARGIKGVCHLVSGEDIAKPRTARFLRKVELALQARVTHHRGPAVPPWVLRDPARMKKNHYVVDHLRRVGIDSVIGVGPDADMTLEQWAVYCRAVALEFPSVRYFSIMNESDNDPAWPPERYARWLHVAAREIRTVRPDALIVAPELGHGKHWPMEAYLAAIDWRDVDVIAIHPYNRGEAYVRLVLELTPEDKPVWITEDGATSWASAAIRGTFKVYLGVEKDERFSRVEAVFIYAFFNPDDLPWNLVDLVGEEFRPRKRFAAFGKIECRR